MALRFKQYKGLHLREVNYSICEETTHIHSAHKGFGLSDALGTYKDYTICLKTKKCQN